MMTGTPAGVTTATAFICATCGTQHAPSPAPPAACAICQDPRQWVPAAGQAWTTMDALARRHAVGWREAAPGLLGLGMFPDFAIAQRALLVRTPAGNVLWDCVALLEPDLHVQVALDYLLYDTAATAQLRELNPHGQIIVHAELLSDIPALYAAGASYVTTPRLLEADDLLKVIDAAEKKTLDHKRGEQEMILKERSEVIP